MDQPELSLLELAELHFAAQRAARDGQLILDTSLVCTNPSKFALAICSKMRSTRRVPPLTYPTSNRIKAFAFDTPSPDELGK
jgi:hypothetical protein